MNAFQMYNEFEIIYEAIASGDAAGYEPYEVSIILSEAQEQIIKEIVQSGIESNDLKSLVVGPWIKPSYFIPSSTTSLMYSDSLEFGKDISDYWLIVNERLKISSGADSVEVKPITHEFWNANKNNPYKNPKAGKYYWRMLQYGSSSLANFIITGVTTISNYYINYLDSPEPIIVPGVSSNTTIDDTEVTESIITDGKDCNYNSIIHRDIVSRAAENAAAYVKDTESFQLLKAKYSK